MSTLMPQQVPRPCAPPSQHWWELSPSGLGAQESCGPLGAGAQFNTLTACLEADRWVEEQVPWLVLGKGGSRRMPRWDAPGRPRYRREGDAQDRVDTG